MSQIRLTFLKYIPSQPLWRFWRCWTHVFRTLEIGSDKCVNEKRDGLDGLKPCLVLGFCTGFLCALEKLRRSEPAIPLIRTSTSQLGRPSDSTVRGDVSVIRQIGNHSPPTCCKLNITLVIAEVNILPCHFDYVKI